MSFVIDVPEIYQLELTTACQLSCKQCIRNDPRIKRPIGYINIKLIEMMIDRNDFEGSYFVELHMNGEPLLHPDFDNIVNLVKEKTTVRLGMSTNGLLIHKHIDAICKLDNITISLDSANKVRYEKLRGNNYDKVVSAINLLLSKSKRPVIDVQAFQYVNGEDELPRLNEMWKNKDVNCRVITDCCALFQDRKPICNPIDSGLCLNPWLSVSVQYSGNVVSCCFSRDIVYGNLYEQNLRDIWNGSQFRKRLMDDMMSNYGMNRIPCKLCYARSPVLFHIKMLEESLKK